MVPSIPTRNVRANAALLGLALLGGCSAPTYRELPREKEFPGLATEKGVAAALPHRTVQVVTRGGGRKKVEVAVHEVGPGSRDRVVVLLHGVLSDSRVWRFVVG